MEGPFHERGWRAAPDFAPGIRSPTVFVLALELSLNGALVEEYLPWSKVQMKSLLPVRPEARTLFPNATFTRNQNRASFDT